jgi:hypothetical protein
MGLNGADIKADLTKSQYLKITSSDPSVLDIDRENGVFVGKRPGHVDIRISFSEATAMVPAFVRAVNTASAGDMDGVWKAEFIGDWGERPKMVSEIYFDLTVNGNSLSGAVHAASWPGDAVISNGTLNGDRVSFEMVGHSPFQAGRPGAMVTGYPKLCFTGIGNGNEMRIDLLWTEARTSCENGKLLRMAGKRLAD